NSQIPNYLKSIFPFFHIFGLLIKCTTKPSETKQVDVGSYLYQLIRKQ
ncbi:hypothetical protein X975_24558, partial [Stegodyphus mimosarum]